ncbi:MFS family permease [Altererythrobacter atlanticus]|uniref:D-galactonate transporter n=1 Tax=Croceibacterium atlanticum TaxID=1267766 RepID=A0A0F7KVF4_9SPHN|nr:MFS transporter [Croceibacterium atlanticum]AKH43644.1 D-galactonate transporter [Croceibacterium atlanticum]MBB5733872.1 MFS family permease [Croceibacterium atlanticum]
MSEGGLRRDAPWLALIVLMAISTVGFIDRIVVNVLVEPVKAEFGLSDTQVSLMGVAFTVLNIGVGLIIARIAERTRRMTLISVGTLLWSVATAACGVAASWIQLLVSRMGVGLGEAIGLPSLQSVIADYFPANRRGFAISILMLAPPVGAFIGFVGGGWIAENFDWRFTFLVAALPGLLLAMLAYAIVAEPARGRHDPGAGDEVPPLMDVLRRLTGLSSARNLVIGSALAAMLGFGLNYFFASLMIRRFELSIGEAGFYAGVIASLPAALSVVGTGWLGDKFGEKTPAAYALVPAVSLLLGGPIYAFAITRDALVPLLALISIATFLNFGYLGVTYATLQNLMHPRMRATASAMLNVVYGLASAGGPLFLGMLSDRMAQTHGVSEGLVIAMAIFGLAYAWAGVHYLLAARRLKADMAVTALRSGS